MPGSEEARRLTDRDYLLCALHMILDEEERLAQLCPDCRARAEGEQCPVCGRETVGRSGGVNTAFDAERYERLKRGERH